MVHRSLIAGRPSPHRGREFTSIDPSTGRPTATDPLEAATREDVDEACASAWRAFRSAPPERARAGLLGSIADRLERLGRALVDAAVAETGLAAARIEVERDRTLLQLRMFARLLEDQRWREPIIEPGDPKRRPLPRPDLRRALHPLGPVAVFGASNFPLAYSVAGGDTASALAAGCPVVVKGHSAHPHLGLMVAEAVTAAVADAGLDPGWFSFLLAGGERDLAVGVELVQHPSIRAVGFTGSVSGGTAIMRLAAQRPQPIAVFAEMGSVNPVFVLPKAAERRAAAIAEQLAASALNSAGQMCTCPGIIAVPSDGGDALVAELIRRFEGAAAQVMLTTRTLENFRRRTEEIAGALGVRLAALSPSAPAPGSGAVLGTPTLFEVEAEAFLDAPQLFEECFGPCSIVVRCPDAQAREALAAQMPGSLTGTLHVEPEDHAEAKGLLVHLADRVGRLIFNGVPTGVEVTSAMVHSGPYPACSRPDSTAVGPLAIRRWLRPVCWQNAPPELLPAFLNSA